jgi:hypothetical protein
MRRSLKLLLILGIGLALRRRPGGGGPDGPDGNTPDADGTPHGRDGDPDAGARDTDGDGDPTTYKGRRADGDLTNSFDAIQEGAQRGRAGDSDGDGRPDLPPKQTDDAAWRSSEDPNLTLTDEQNRAADEFLERARNAEPGITGNMKDNADATGGDMVGLDYRLKDPESFKRKLATELAENGGDLDAALRDMKDSVRYTTTWDTGDYTQGVQDSTQRLRDQGYEPVKWKPTWGDEGYRGVNSFWRDPATGQVFEVQFHTPESFDAKMRTHDLYDQIRLLPEGDPRRVELERQQDEIFDNVPHPPGAENL